MSEEYWDGALWVYQADITSDAMDAGDHIYTVVPGAGNELEVLYGSLFNGDTSSRAANIQANDGTNLIKHLGNESLGAGTFLPIFSVGPSNTADTILAMGRLILAGTLQLVAQVSAVAVNQDTAFALVCRIRGAIPTVTEAMSAGTPVVSINREQVF